MRSHSRRRFVGHIFSALAVSLSLSALLLGANMAHAQNERQLDTVYGAVPVTGQPERVVAMDEGALDTEVGGGVERIGAMASLGGLDVPDYLQRSVPERIAIMG